MGIKKLKDKFAIFELAYKFADAANRRDASLFQSLWADEGAEWVIGEPINRTFTGKENMGISVSQMLDRWEFFVQMVNGGVVEIRGKKAYARFYIHELANSKAGKGNDNLSMYEDELIKKGGKWYFKKRTYQTIFQSEERLKGQVIGLPKLFTAIPKKVKKPKVKPENPKEIIAEMS